MISAGFPQRSAAREHVIMDVRPNDLDATRAAIATRELVATASGYLTGEVAVHLEFEDLAPFKNLLKRFFSPAAWSGEDDETLSRLVRPRLDEGWWEHDLGGGITLAHGVRSGRYVLWVGGASEPATSIFDRTFDGPVVPEATPHPRKVRFALGGDPAPGIWYRRTDPSIPTDERVKRLFAEPDVTDVMVAGDFVTIGISGSWEQRLEPLLGLVTELFSAGAVTAPSRTREELIMEAGRAHAHEHPAAPRDLELHLLAPDDPDHRRRLLASLDDEDPRVRRVAVAVLAEATAPDPAHEVLRRGASDPSLLVRRTAIDAAADREEDALRDLFHASLGDADPWIRWRAVRALGDIDIGPSRFQIQALSDDPEFRVRFEVARVLRLA
jgi:hypothetical protein